MKYRICLGIQFILVLLVASQGLAQEIRNKGFDRQKLRQMTTAIRSGEYGNIHSVHIMSRNKVVYEEYFEGEDEEWGDKLGVVKHGADQLHDLRSVSKSIVSACVGIAIKQGKIKGLGQRVFEYFPELSHLDTGRKSAMTIEHLLEMSSGLEWNEDVPYSDPKNSEIQMVNSPNQDEFVLSRPLVHAPGLQWNYNGGTTQLLASIIKRATGERIDTFAMKHLFKPLDIKQWKWTIIPELGEPAAASGLRLTPTDILKFGMLYMNRGRYKDKPVLTPEWVNESLKPQVSRGKAGAYGLQFWLFNDSILGQRKQVVAAVGNGDQRIFIDQDNDLLVVITAGNYNVWNLPKSSHELMRDWIYPAVTQRRSK